MARVKLSQDDISVLAELEAAKNVARLVSTHTDAAWLMQVWSVINRTARVAAQRVYPRQGGLAAVETLGALACARATELTCRSEGNEKSAAVYAEHVELYLAELPDWAK